METEEIWKDIPNYEGLYQASSMGRVRSLTRLTEFISGRIGILNGRIRKVHISNDGYYKTCLCKNGKQKSFRIHQLVAMAFLGHEICGHKMVINHIDSNRLNNKLENLEVVTSRENCAKRVLPKTSKYVGVSWCSERGKWKAQIKINGKGIMLGRFKTEEEAYNAYQNELIKLNQLEPC